MSTQLDKLIGRIKDLRVYEEDGRKRAYDRDSKPYSDALWAMGAGNYLNTTIHELIDMVGESDPEISKLIDFSRSLSAELNLELPLGADFCLSKNIKRKDCLIDPSIFKKVDEGSEKLFGSKCTWLAGEIPREKYNLSSAINDASACLHKVIDFLEDYIRKWHREGKCLWRKD